jgi:hypothetical protein
MASIIGWEGGLATCPLNRDNPNQLRKSWSIDRTELYNSLIRQFILRERCKQRGFSDRKQKEIDYEINWEMLRLRVVALGMYNRSKTHIFARELDEDLAFFQLHREQSVTKGRVLSQAEMLLGSFFFIHKSKALHRSRREMEVQESTAFEFLHNTFNEFLIADYLLRSTMQEVKRLRKAEVDEDMGAIRITMLESPDGMGTPWLAGLSYTPLFTRPAILQMIREWGPKVYQEASLTEEDFVSALEEMIISQLKRLLHKREMPSIFLKSTSPEGQRISYPEFSLLKHLAIFSINLIILRILCGQSPFILKDSQIAVDKEDERAWDRLLNLWRSEFSLEALNGLTAVMVAKRGTSCIELSAKESFQVIQIPKGAVDKLRLVYNVAMALGDTITARLAFSHLTRLPGSPF